MFFFIIVGQVCIFKKIFNQYNQHQEPQVTRGRFSWSEASIEVLTSEGFGMMENI